MVNVYYFKPTGFDNVYCREVSRFELAYQLPNVFVVSCFPTAAYLSFDVYGGGSWSQYCLRDVVGPAKVLFGPGTALCEGPMRLPVVPTGTVQVGVIIAPGMRFPIPVVVPILRWTRQDKEGDKEVAGIVEES